MQEFATGNGLRYFVQFIADQLRVTPHQQIAKTLKIIGFIITVFLVQVQAAGYGQNNLEKRAVNLNVHNESVEKILQSIEQQTGFVFFVPSKIIEKTTRQTINAKNLSVVEALKLCLRDVPYKFIVKDKTIFILETSQPQEYSNQSDTARLGILQGTVIDSTGGVIVGANIYNKTLRKGSQTDFQGKFSIEAAPGNKIEISFVGMETSVISVIGDNNPLNVILRKSNTIESTITVTANTGYQKLKANEITGSVVVIGENKLDQRIAPDLISKLEGITNGMVFNKGIDGSNQIRIRGESTIYANPNPLIVIDNFPFDGDLNTIDPNTIESVTILKDAAAASIWGVRAGNGVVVITTKRGKYNQSLKIEVNSNVTYSGKPNLYYGNKVNPSDYIDLEIELFAKGYYNSQFNDLNKVAISPVAEILNKEKNGAITSARAKALIDELRNNDIRDELLNSFYENPFHQQHQVNISSGNNKSNYYLSAGYDKDRSYILNNQSQRVTLNSQHNFQPFNSLEVQNSIFFTSLQSNSAVSHRATHLADILFCI